MTFSQISRAGRYFPIIIMVRFVENSLFFVLYFSGEITEGSNTDPENILRTMYGKCLL